MKSLRSLIGIVLALALAALAMPAFAQTKQYTLVMSSPPNAASVPIPSGANQPLRAVFTNSSPQGGANSSFNALRLAGPTTNTYTITKVTKVTRSDTGEVLTGITFSAQEIRVQGLTSVGKGVSVTIDFVATVPSVCDSTDRWNPGIDDDVWSGSQVGAGQPFAMQMPPSVPTTTVYDGPTLVITQFPATVAATVDFDVVVEQKKNCATEFPSISLTGPGYSGTPSSAISADGNTKTTTFTGQFEAPTMSPATLTLEASAGSQTKTASIIVYADGDVACGVEVDPDYTNSGFDFDAAEPGQAKSVRQLWNSNAASCLKVPVDFTNLLLNDGKVSLLWPSTATDSQKAALFRNTVTGKARPLSSTAVPTPPGFQFGWAKDGNDAVIYANALMCLDEEAPRPYASLVSQVNSIVEGTTEIEVTWDSANKPVAPGTNSTTDPNGWKPIPAAGNFEFTIGDERFVGTRVGTPTTTGTVSTVKIKVLNKNVGSTPSVTFPLNAGTFVLSVVMPIYTAAEPSVYKDKPVRMCVIANGIRMWVPAAGAPGSLPTPQYFQTLEYFDGDGWGVEK